MLFLKTEKHFFLQPLFTHWKLLDPVLIKIDFFSTTFHSFDNNFLKKEIFHTSRQDDGRMPTHPILLILIFAFWPPSWYFSLNFWFVLATPPSIIIHWRPQRTEPHEMFLSFFLLGWWIADSVDISLLHLINYQNVAALSGSPCQRPRIFRI